MNINKLNLNLLRALDALLSIKNISLAAKHIGVSQSTMSLSLKQLRRLFDNQLLVPGQYKMMQLTPLANSLLPEVRNTMNHIDRIFNINDAFNQGSSQRIFRIGMSGLISVLLLKPLIDLIQQHAPYIQLKIVHLKNLTSSDLFESKHYDLLIGMFDQVPNNLKTQRLFNDQSVLVSCQNHPLSHKEEITVDDFLEFPLIQFSLQDAPMDNYFTKCIKKVTSDRHVKVSVGQALIPLLMLPHSNFLAITITKAADYFKQSMGLKTYPVPFEVKDFMCQQYWHPKDDEDPAHQWIRNSLKKIANSL